MASAQSERSSVLQEELTCPVCLDLYRDPHLLPCGHNFCKTCLDRLKRQADRGRFRCPECRDSHRCGTNFQKNFKLANIADDYRHRRRATSAAATALKSRELLPSSLSPHQARSMFAVPCDYCPPAAADAPGVSAAGGESSAASDSQERGDKQEAPAAAPMFAVKTCLKCEVSMCQEHVKPHLELPAFREHPLTEPMNDFWKRKCPDHDEIFRYYCIDDKMCVCNACTIEGGHSGHTIKTLKNTMKDLKVTLDKQLYRVERKYSMAEKKLQEQREKERQNKKFMDDSEQCLTRLGEDMKAKVLRFVMRLRECARAHYDTNGLAIQKNTSKICQDKARLQEVRLGIERLMEENDPFRFIEAYKTTGKQCRRQLRKNMFYPEYVDMETEVLGVMMEEEMRKFLDEELACHIVATINSLCHISDLEEEEEQEDNEEEAGEEEEDDDDDDDLDDSSEEEIRTEGEEEEEEEDDEDEDEDLNDRDTLYSPRDEDDEDEEEEDEDEEDVEEEEEEDEEERGV
ncbi:E3 ubiquitin/ISG15 ligase TRIM25 [Mugil cephalus]|uniref:E3 ubiquitin/ISG15 ligase TRIM25 n=1 Tax=Mugil cephalus TaxID=48193 RepID=UPI001FB80484|nr:E3 ubiquitin/ISG15 ligase TRIM25 [Mugil cephalus]XP_047433709.1 E3 ubiquitin/ISG15 ligase TRIM25 [Mugil cephalus]XP_047433797.1 E3 ubiquitin/ISG15 ligase TRIM25 [Mugil cephalus]